MSFDAFPSYRSHKVVKAAPITAVTRSDGDAIEVTVKVAGKEVVVPVPEGFERPGAQRCGAGDYLVIYDDSYKSWSPKAAFELGYSQISRHPYRPAESRVLGKYMGDC